jgi:cobalt/nickel transport system permease protein
LIAAIEFGIQPALFHDAGGTPLYAPYRLSVAIPAMMIGHLTFVGMAEAVISAGLIAYLQVADPVLLRGSSGLAQGASAAALRLRPAVNSLRRLWLAIAGLLLLTPLGIIVAGTAWGEWSPAELARMAPNPTSANPAVPAVPTGLQRLSNLWTAPFPAYAPAFVRSRGFGYLLSAMFGVGILLCLSLLAQSIVERLRGRGSPA